MQSVQKNIAIPTTLRVSARQRDDGAADYFDADITKSVIGDGLQTVFSQTPRLLLDPTAGYEDLLTTLRNARIVMATEAVGSLSSASEPTGMVHEFTGAAVVTSRLDTSGVDEQATIEFRVPQDSLLPQLAAEDVVYARAYLMATVYGREFNSAPVVDDLGNPAVVATNTGAEVFDTNTDLYIVPATGAAPITVGGGVTEKSTITTGPDTAGDLLGDYFTLSSPTTDYYVWYREMIAAMEEITEVDCEADTAGSLNNHYWTFDTTTVAYYVWYNVAGNGSDPLVPSRTGVEVAINTDATADDVALATALVIDALGTAGANNTLSVVTVTNAVAGDVVDAADGNTSWTSAWTITQQGTDQTWTADPAPAGTGIPITLVQDATAEDVANATHAILNAMGDFSTSVLTNVISLANTAAGSVTDIADGTTGWAGAFVVTEQGSAAVGDALFLDRTDIISDTTSSEDVVIGAMEFRVTNADEIANDLMHGTIASQTEIVFRLVV